MTNFNTEIEEIEKRFDEKFAKQFFSADCTCGVFHATALKAFLRAELPSLLSKFAAEINGDEEKLVEFIREAEKWPSVPPKDRDEQLFLKEVMNTAWNAHHRSVAEKAEEIIKDITT